MISVNMNETSSSTSHARAYARTAQYSTTQKCVYPTRRRRRTDTHSLIAVLLDTLVCNRDAKDARSAYQPSTAAQ